MPAWDWEWAERRNHHWRGVDSLLLTSLHFQVVCISMNGVIVKVLPPTVSEKS
jgi:hypothetical protein